MQKNNQFPSTPITLVEQHIPGPPEESWKPLKSNITKAAKKTVGFEKKEPVKKPWVTDDMIQKMEERRKWKHQTTEEAKRQYRKLNNDLSRETDRARDWRSINRTRESCKQMERIHRRTIQQGQQTTRCRFGRTE